MKKFTHPKSLIIIFFTARQDYLVWWRFKNDKTFKESIDDLIRICSRFNTYPS